MSQDAVQSSDSLIYQFDKYGGKGNISRCIDLTYWFCNTNVY